MRQVLASLVFASIVSTAVAQEAPTPGYRGVVPGRTGQPSHIRGTPGARPTLVTWPGFQPNSDGSSRFFFQTTSAPRFTTRKAAGSFTIVLHDVGINERNTTFPLDTRFFATPVNRATTRRAGRDVHIVFELRADVEPTVAVEPAEGGFSFVYVNFAAGDYGVSPRPAAPPSPPAGPVVPEEPRSASPSHVVPRTQSRPTWGSQPAEQPRTVTPAQQRAMEQERPPGQ